MAESSNRRIWTETRIESELHRALRDRDDWPSYAEFVRAGKKALRDAVTRSGGAPAWAPRMGVRYVDRRPGTPVRWTDARIRTELKRFLRDRDDWPSYADFEHAGRRPLRQAIMRTGGAERWAAELGVPRHDLRAGSHLVWDDDRIERAVAPLVARLGRWPTKSEFRHAGLASALTAMYARRGIAWWRARLAAPAPTCTRPLPNRRVWGEADIEAALRAFCAGRDTWPTPRAFTDAGLGRLYRAASRYGGVPSWRARLGLWPSSSRPAPRPCTMAGER
jgi:hypothetical protein